jgi:hypothetical protein
MRKPLIPSLLVAASMVLGALTVVFDWGWVVWMLVLGLGAIGLFFLVWALGRAKRMLAVGAVAAVALVVGGVAAVRLQPVLPTGFAIGDSAEVVGRSGDSVVIEESSGDEVRGLSTAGDELWAHDAGSGLETSTLVDDLVILVYGGDAGSRAVALNASSGDEVWTRELPSASELLTVTPETLVFSTPEEGTSALFLATGIPRWANPEGAISTFRSAGYRHVHPRVAAPKNEAWGLLEGDDADAPDAASINLDSGELGTRMDLGETDYLMVAGVLVTEELGFGANAATTLRGTSVDGRVGWSRQIDTDGAPDMAAIGGEIVVRTPGGSLVITASNGELAERPLPEGWTYDDDLLSSYKRQFDARYELTLDEDGSSGAFDRVTGEHVELSGRGSLIAGARSLGDSDTTVLVTRVSDAVGGEAYRYDVVADGSVRQTIHAESDEVDWRPGVLQIGDRVVPVD